MNTSLLNSQSSQVLQLKKQIILSQKKQSQLQSYISQLQDKLSKQMNIQDNLQRLKTNEIQIRDVLRLKVAQMQQDKEIREKEFKLTQELLIQSQKQIDQLKRLYEAEVNKNREFQNSKRLENSRGSQASDKLVLDQNYRITELNKQIQIMKQLHFQQINKIQNQYQKTIQKVIQQKAHLEKFMRLKEDERIRVKTPTFKDRKFSEDVYNKELERLFNRKIDQFEDQLRKKDEDLLEMEGEIDRLKNKCLDSQEKYTELTDMIRNAMQEIQTLKGQKDILEKTLDFSKKIAEQQRIQFNKILQIQRDNHSAQIDQIRQSLQSSPQNQKRTHKEQITESKRVCSFILTKLKVVHAFISDLKKYFLNEHSQMKQVFAAIAQKLIDSMSNPTQNKGYIPQYEQLIQKYKLAIRQKDKQILELRKSKFKYSKNIQYLNKILVDD